MCNVCCKELRGWCRSFTRTEVALTTLQAALLIIFIAFLTFVILHLMACSNVNDMGITTKPPGQSTKTISKNYTPTTMTMPTTLDPKIECTWKPSEKTEAAIHYYEKGLESTVIPSYTELPEGSGKVGNVNNELDNLADGKVADNIRKGFLLALVKMKLIEDVTFGCVLTIISEYSTLTAASCIESIEEVDTVDSFVMLESYGERHLGRTHAVSDVLIHPEYQGMNKKYDVAVLKSEDSLVRKGRPTVRLPTMLDALLITIGEPLSLLGYGRFRRAEGEASRAVREVRARTLPGAQCSGAGATRHLSHGAGQRAAGCSPRPMCAGTAADAAAGAGAAPGAPPCAYCAGTPLLRGAVLLGTMAAAPCGDSCEPALYVNIATVLDWLQSILNNEQIF